MGGLWISSELEGHTESGAFSEQHLGISAVEYFPIKAYNTLKDPKCKWHWKKGTKLGTLFINVMKSDMAHVLRDYIDDGYPDVKANSEFERESADEDGYDDANDLVEIDPELRRNGFEKKSDLELLEELEQKETRHNRGYKIARAAAKGNSMMERYVELAFDQLDHRAISKKLKKTKAEVMEIETELIARIKVVLC